MSDETPEIPPGFYRMRPGGRLWAHDELVVVWFEGGWCVFPRVALARLPEGCELRPAQEASDDAE